MTNFCKACGAVSSPGMLQCEYCDAPMENGGVSYDVFLASFSKRFQEVAISKGRRERDTEILRKQSALVSSLTVPSDRYALINLTAYVVGQVESIGENYSSSNREMAAILLPSWLSKAKEISVRLKLTASNDDQVVQALHELDRVASYKSASTRVSHANFLSKLRWWLFFPFAIIGSIRGIGIIFDDNSHEKERIAPMLMIGIGGWIAFFVTKKFTKEAK